MTTPSDSNPPPSTDDAESSSSDSAQASEPPQPTDAARAEPVSRRRQALRFGMQLLIGLGLFFLISQWQTRGLLPRGEAPAPNFALRDLQGQLVRLSDYQGKAVLLHFWATWCGVCRQEVGALNRLAESLGDDQVLLTVVADGHDREAVARFVEERGVRYPVLLGNDALIDAYRVTMFPTNYFLDRDGHIASSTVGMSTRWSMQARLGCAR